MATSGRIQTQVVRRSSYFYMSWSATEQDVANNRTKIHWVVGLHTDAGQDYWYTNAVRINNAYLNGSQVSSGGTWSNITTGGDHDLQSGDIWVGHEADGTKSFDYSVSGWLYSYGDYGASGTSTLNTIPRASQPSCITYPNTTNDIGNMNSTITIHMNRNSSAFTHTVKYYFGNASGTIATGVTNNCSWQIPLSLANQVPNAVSGVGSIEVTTYNGSTKIGTKSVGFTVHVPSSVVPSFSSLGVTRVDGSVPSGWGIYVQGKSKATLTINGAAGSYGSTIKSYSISGGGFSSASSSFTTGFLNTTGTITFTATITDSRGRTASKTASISVVAYSAPSISSASGNRCNSSGTALDDGTYAKIRCTFSYASCSSKNTITTKVEFKKVTDSSYTNGGTFSSATDKIIGSGSINIDSSYNLKFTITDAFASATYQIVLGTALTTMDFRKGGKGIAVGKVSESDNLFDSQWPVRIGSTNGNGIWANGKTISNGKIQIPYNITTTGGTYYPIMTLKTDDGDAANIGAGADDFFGFIGFFAENTANSYNYRLGVNTRNGNIVANGNIAKSIGLLAYPVGSIYMSVNSTSPATLFGGTWVAWGTGRVPVGINTSDADFKTVEKTGGSKVLQKHTHTGTTGGAGSHNHNMTGRAVSGSGGVQVETYSSGDNARTVYTNTVGNHTHSFTTGEAGTGTSGNLQPYIVCYMWKRTA